MKKIYIIILGIVAMGLLVFLAGSIPSVFSWDPTPTPSFSWSPTPSWWPSPSPECTGGLYDCPSYGTPYCHFGKCVACYINYPAESGGCPAAYPFCVVIDLPGYPYYAEATCAECRNTYDCDMGYPDIGNTPYCVDGDCVQCRTSDDCGHFLKNNSEGKPYCYFGKCVECENAAQCGVPGCINTTQYRSYACVGITSRRCVPLTMNCNNTPDGCCSDVTDFCASGTDCNWLESQSPTPTP